MSKGSFVKKSTQSDEPEALIVGQHYKEIDALRALAVLLVIWFHAAGAAYSYISPPDGLMTNIYHNITVIGRTGVDLFFVISGFLITGILMDTAHKANNLKNFYIRRTLRIFPLYYMSLIVIFALIYIFYGGVDVEGELLPHIFYFQNWRMDFRHGEYIFLNHYWSLAVEEQFYIVWPLLFLFCFKRSARMVGALCLSLFIIACFCRYYFLNEGELAVLFMNTFCRIDTLVLGSFAAFILREYKPDMKLVKDISALSLGVLSFVIVMTLLVFAPKHGYDIAIVYHAYVPIALFHVFLVTYIFSLNKTGHSCRILNSKYILKIGQVSYGIYVFHWPITILLAKQSFVKEMDYMTSHGYLFLMTLLLSFVCAAISYKFFEKPILKLKDRYAPI